MHERILIIDDDSKLNDLLKEYLSSYGYEVMATVDPLQGISEIQKAPPRIVILDIMLPHMDGFEVCKKVRAFSDVPIIMLTARGEITDRIVGLELGADDYLPKPFEPRELVARIQSILRRSMKKDTDTTIKRGALTIDVKRLQASLNGNPLDLTTLEIDLLILFAKNPGKVYNRDMIIEELRGYEWDVFDRSVDVLISRIRSKLGDDPKNPMYIKTVWGRGYQFLEDHDNVS